MADARSSARGRPKAHERGDRFLPQHCGGTASASSGVLLRTQTNVIDQQRGCCACVVDDLLKCATRATETLSGLAQQMLHNCFRRTHRWCAYTRSAQKPSE
jgi:hypothetical protein